MRPIVVLETNEVPLRLLRWYANLRPSSALAGLLDTAAVAESEVREVLDRELYPSQTWASQSMGVPHRDHQVYWYGDPKPDGFPAYWQVAAQHRRVGIVGSLHSSPIRERCTGRGVVFAIPDAFAADPATIPDHLEPLQRMTLAMAEDHSRAVGAIRPDRDWLAAGGTALRSGLRPSTAARLCALVAGIAAGRIPRERLRTAQFLLFGDVFESLTRSANPDLAVCFTNHVAAAMHRYWYANFPDDWEDELYDDRWVARYRGEIPAALDALDRLVGRLGPWCRRTGRTLVLTSSMGQTGGAPLVDRSDHQLVVRDPEAFARAVGVDQRFEVRRCMVPSVTVAFDDERAAVAAAERLATVALAGLPLGVDRSGNIVTWTYVLEAEPDGLLVDGVVQPLEDLGVVVQRIEDHRCGVHHPLGAVIVANSPTARLPSEPFDYLELAPALLVALGLDPLPHHRTPTLTL